MAREELASGLASVLDRIGVLGGSGTSCSYWSSMTLFLTLKSPFLHGRPNWSPSVPVMGAANWWTEQLHHVGGWCGRRCIRDGMHIATITSLPIDCTRAQMGASDLSHLGGEAGAVSARRSHAASNASGMAGGGAASLLGAGPVSDEGPESTGPPLGQELT